jgi:hypothetical protein
VTPEFRLFCLALRRPQRAGDIAMLEEALAARPDWQAILAGVRRHRVGPLLLERLQACRSANLPGEVVDALRRDAIDAATRSLAQTAEVARLARLLAEAGIPLLVLKGVVLSAQLYGDPALRNPRDIDLLVDPARFADAAALLIGSGYRRCDPLLSPRQEAAQRRWLKDAAFEHMASGVHVELHHRLADNPVLFPGDFAELWEGREETAVAGATIATLPRRLLPFYLGVHGAAHGWFELRWLVDLAALLEAPDAADEAVATADKAGLAAPMLHGLLLAHDWLGAPVGESLLARARADRHVRRLHFIVAHLYRGAAWHELPPRGSLRGLLRYSLWLRLYGYALKPGWRYWRYQAAREFIVPADWAALRLPDRWFWLFPVLRPVGWLMRRRRG